MELCRIIIADDNLFFLGILENYLGSFEEFKIVACCNTIDETIQYTNNTQFDILILDLSFNGERSLDHILQIRPTKELFKIICLTSYNNPIITKDVIADGVDLLIGKDSDFKDFPNIIKDLHILNTVESKTAEKETVFLTKRQLTILKCCYQFNTEKEICQHLNISANTLKMHKQHLFSKTGTKNTLELLKFAIQKGIIIT